jgi:hypothetical protein
MSAAPNPELRVQKPISRVSPSGNSTAVRKAPGRVLAAWLRTTYRPIIEQDPKPALGFMACFLGVMFGTLFLIV